MCIYCMAADHAHKWYPDPAAPWVPPTSPPYPLIPTSPVPVIPPRKWTRQELDEFEDLLKRIKDIEDKAGGCPCEDPSKLDFLKDIRARIEAEEAAELKSVGQVPNCS